MNPIARNAKDFWTGVIYLFVGSGAFILSRDYGMGTAVKMGPAYFPTLLSLLLMVIGIISVIRSFLKSGTPIGVVAWKGLLLIVASTLLFGMIVRGAGLILALPLLVIVSALASTRFSWKTSLLEAAGITVFCILVFLKGLGVPLPILGSWFGN
ncbi:MAG: tripartite tricarboxylate transporter TctB family protein [Deltaproteobacteria bacterium]|nr:tripartite tricarboxylate transporter TctB family protein [Deltaproteobacteria bacterium]